MATSRRRNSSVVPRGRIWPEYWVSCGGCDRGIPLAEKTKTAALQTAAIWGWRTTKQNGYVCPDCQKLPEDKS